MSSVHCPFFVCSPLPSQTIVQLNKLASHEDDWLTFYRYSVDSSWTEMIIQSYSTAPLMKHSLGRLCYSHFRVNCNNIYNSVSATEHFDKSIKADYTVEMMFDDLPNMSTVHCPFFVWTVEVQQQSFQTSVIIIVIIIILRLRLLKDFAINAIDLLKSTKNFLELFFHSNNLPTRIEQPSFGILFPFFPLANSPPFQLHNSPPQAPESAACQTKLALVTGVYPTPRKKTSHKQQQQTTCSLLQQQ